MKKDSLNQPFISVVMPVYNAEKFLFQSIESVLQQTYTNFELIIIDDYSSDNSVKTIKEFLKKDTRIKFFSNKQNYGVAYTRNSGVKYAKGDWIAFIDSDDMWQKDKLKKQVELLNDFDNEPILIYTGSSFIDEDNKPYDFIMQVPKTITYKELLKQNIISCSSTLVKKEVLSNVKMQYDNMHEDFLTWLKILKKYNVCAYGINEPLLIYRISRNSKSGNKVKAAKMTYMVYKNFGITLIKRWYYMFCYMIRSIKKYKNF